jgi:hypothetical protein
MAIGLLRYNAALLAGKEPSGLVHSAHHDLESFIYVFLWAILYHEEQRLKEALRTTKAPGKKQSVRRSKNDLDAEIKAHFGRTTFKTIAQARGQLLVELPDVDLPRNLLLVLEDLVDALALQYPRQRKTKGESKKREATKKPVYLTHDDLIEIFDDALSTLQW